MVLEQYTLNGKKALKLRCDVCEKEFNRTYNVKVQASRTEHWCGRECFSQAISQGGSVDSRRRTTNTERYGVPYVINDHDVASKAGVLAHTPEIETRRWKKIHEGWKSTSTCLRRGLTLVRSKSEIEFFDLLSKRLQTVIECPKYINKWFVDGYIAEHNVWVQFDGLYWHSRPDRVEADRHQNEWFEREGKILIRVSDRDWMKDKEGVLECTVMRIITAK